MNLSFKSLSLILSLCAFALAGYVAYTHVSKPRPGVKVNALIGTKPDLNFTLPDADGNMLKLSDWHGKIIVFNFWASWCPPCLREIPLFNKLQKKWEDKNVQFVGIAVDEKESVVNFLAKTPLTYPTMISETGAGIARKLGNLHQTLPYTVIFATDGSIITTRAGEVTETMLNQFILPKI